MSLLRHCAKMISHQNGWRFLFLNGFSIQEMRQIPMMTHTPLHTISPTWFRYLMNSGRQSDEPFQDGLYGGIRQEILNDPVDDGLQVQSGLD